jgi:hypothetical protein
MKTIVRHESQEDFFARMASLAQKLDRGEKVDSCENVSFEDLSEMSSFKTEQERKARKASFKLIEGGGGKGKGKVKELSPSSLHHHLFKKGIWIAASDTFDRDARVMLKKYHHVILYKLDSGMFVTSEERPRNDKLRAKRRDK